MAISRLHSAISLRIKEVVLLPVYFRRHASKVRVENIPPEVDVTCLVAAIHCRSGLSEVKEISEHMFVV